MRNHFKLSFHANLRIMFHSLFFKLQARIGFCFQNLSYFCREDLASLPSRKPRTRASLLMHHTCVRAVSAHFSAHVLQRPLQLLLLSSENQYIIPQLVIFMKNCFQGVKSPEKSGLPDIYVNVHLLPGTNKVKIVLFLKAVYMQQELNPHNYFSPLTNHV